MVSFSFLFFLFSFISFFFSYFLPTSFPLPVLLSSHFLLSFAFFSSPSSPSPSPAVAPGSTGAALEAGGRSSSQDAAAEDPDGGRGGPRDGRVRWRPGRPAWRAAGAVGDQGGPRDK